ncbi:MAG: ATP-binding protein [Bacteroidales bacterium]|nr:ATP-binding protein [Bacteroidales bacterium]
MKIEREINQELWKWKNAPNRKPLLLKGTRQIGKSWALREFGQEHYEHVLVFDFDEHPEYKSLFEASKDPERIIKELSVYSEVPLLPEKTLIIFDEIQECEEALNSLKYFSEKAPQIHVAAAGSLLGVAVRSKRMKVPVGKVEILNMYPITFKEFLGASDSKTYNYLSSIQKIDHLPEPIMNRLATEYKRYMVCGGMPEAANAMLENMGIAAVDKILSDILALYEIDFAKYATPLQSARIHSLWHSLPTQLSKENRKFIYNVIKSGARSKDYEDAVMWLEDAGVVYKIQNITKPGVPLSAYADPNAFKLYSCDVGLLRRLARLSPEAILNPTSGYTEFKGAMAENAALQSLMPNLDRTNPYYWTSGNTAEVEFVIQHDVEIIPIEVKAEENISGRSLGVYNQKYSPTTRMRASMLNLQYNGNLLSLPSPILGWFPQLLKLR